MSSFDVRVRLLSLKVSNFLVAEMCFQTNRLKGWQLGLMGLSEGWGLFVSSTSLLLAQETIRLLRFYILHMEQVVNL